jgi:hypothetical protein
VFQILFIIILALTPFLFSLWLRRKVESQAQRRLQAAMNFSPPERRSNINLPTDSYYIEGVGYVIGDISCQYNSKSPYLRCALHPCATSCENCRDYIPN